MQQQKSKMHGKTHKTNKDNCFNEILFRTNPLNPRSFIKKINEIYASLSRIPEVTWVENVSCYFNDCISARFSYAYGYIRLDTIYNNFCSYMSATKYTSQALITKSNNTMVCGKRIIPYISGNFIKRWSIFRLFCDLFQIINHKILNTLKLYPVSFSLRPFKIAKNYWRKLKMLHVFPIFTNLWHTKNPRYMVIWGFEISKIISKNDQVLSVTLTHPCYLRYQSPRLSLTLRYQSLRLSLTVSNTVSLIWNFFYTVTFQWIWWTFLKSTSYRYKIKELITTMSIITYCLCFPLVCFFLLHLIVSPHLLQLLSKTPTNTWLTSMIN